MMAGIRARSRPRKKSTNFRRVRWWLLREAAFNVIYPHAVPRIDARSLRAFLLSQPQWRIERYVEVALRLHPERRYWPPGSA